MPSEKRYIGAKQGNGVGTFRVASGLHFRVTAGHIGGRRNFSLWCAGVGMGVRAVQSSIAVVEQTGTAQVPKAPEPIMPRDSGGDTRFQ